MEASSQLQDSRKLISAVMKSQTKTTVNIRYDERHCFFAGGSVSKSPEAAGLTSAVILLRSIVEITRNSLDSCSELVAGFLHSKRRLPTGIG